jgi:hypothetical protein
MAGVQPRVVSLWQHRDADHGLEGLKDKPRPSRAPIYTKATDKRILRLLDKPPPEGFARWTGHPRQPLHPPRKTNIGSRLIPMCNFISRRQARPGSIRSRYGQIGGFCFELRVLNLMRTCSVRISQALSFQGRSDMSHSCSIRVSRRSC